MKSWPRLVLGLLVLLPIACQKGKFSEVKPIGETYEIKVVDPNGADASAATTTTIEGVSASDSADSGMGGTDDVDSASTATNGKGSDKAADKRRDNEPGQGGGAEGSDCAVSAGIARERVKVNGSQKSLTLAPQEAFALKVSGNTNQVKLKMTSENPGARIAAICLFVTGNQSHVTLDIGVSVGKIFVKARGNKALVEATVSKDGVIENLQVDAAGNQPSIIMRGEGSYPCEQVGASVSCEKP